MKILYLTSRLPIPPLVKGDLLRDFYILKELAFRGHKIILVSFYRNNENHDPNLEMLKMYCQEIKLVKFDVKKQALNLLKVVYSAKPLQVLLYNSKAFQGEVNNVIQQDNFDVAYTHFARLAEFVRRYNIPKIIDFQDSFEKNMKDRYLKEKNILIKTVALIEAKRMKGYEKQVSQHFSYSTVVSERDLNPEHKNMFVVPNGIQDLKTMQERDKKTYGLLFMGNMSYFPNEDAAFFLIKEVMPIISKKLPNLKLYIVGNLPSKKLQKYNSTNIVVTGFVPDLYPYLAKSRIAVAPLRYGTGIQNKVLDAMVVGIPQIVSKRAAEGLHNLSGEEFIISECERYEFSEKIISLWDDFQLQEQLIENGKKYVLSNYSWGKSVEILEKLFQMAIEKNNSI
jgi:sugar transferase (PEP-CTERM/EpsH1 system associated)